MRAAIKALEDAQDSIKGLRHEHIQRYVEETSGQLLYITDHAKVRYLERVENLRLEGNTDQEKLLSAGANTIGLSRRIISRKEEEKALLSGVERFRKNGHILLIKRLAVVTVTMP